MEKLKTLPFYRRFSFKVFLFNAILLFSFFQNRWTLWKEDYKELSDRIRLHNNLFYYVEHLLGRTNKSEWPEAIDNMPAVFFQQRICVFETDMELYYDGGFMTNYDWEYYSQLRLPHPYIDWSKYYENPDLDVYISYLKSIDVTGKNPYRMFRATRTIEYPSGLDRVIIMGRYIRSADGEEMILTMSHSLVDILIHERGLKEAKLFRYLIIAALSIILTIILSWSVTSPLKKLYGYSLEIAAGKRKEKDFKRMPKRGEIGAICQALQSLIAEQNRKSENFSRFSSDIVHELKTPLAAIRSGLEVYSESDSEEEKEKVLGRVNEKISRMENLMNEIRYIGVLESGAEREEICGDIPEVCADLLNEFQDNEIDANFAPGLSSRKVPISREKLYQVLSNLVKNAVSFSPAKGSVSLVLEIRNDFLLIRISDRGPGILDEAFDDIAKRFYTLRPGGKENHSGLGLSIINAILGNCGGNMTYRNRLSGGAEFTCRIPCSDYQVCP